MVDSLMRGINRAKLPPPRRHKWVRPWMIAKGEPLRQLVTEIQEAVLLFEEQHYPRVRVRRPADHRNHEDLIRALVVNLAHATLAPPLSGRLAIRAGNPRKGAGRYEHPAFGKGVKPVIDHMHGMGILDFRLPVAMRGEVSSIAPTPAFIARVDGLGVTFADFGRDEREEVLILTRKAGARGAPFVDTINYKETSETNELREGVRRVNAFLGQADIDFITDGLSPIVDPQDRQMERRFVLLRGQETERFDLGGRLFGGFWINLASDRRKNIRISGECVADLDFSSMFARLAYAAIGVNPPEGDLYAIRGLEDYRSGVKLAFNVFLFDTKKVRKAWPKEMGIGVGTDAEAASSDLTDGVKDAHEGRLPAGWENPERLRTAILEKHPALKGAFGRRMGYGLMFTESRVLMAVLHELIDRDITALPLHDGIMVAASKKNEALEVMLIRGLKVTGASIPAEEKR